MRYSKQRQIVHETLINSHDHLTAEQIYNLAKETDEKISIATVYRNLNQLWQRGYINRINLPDSPGVFDGDLQPHYHFLCEECNELINIPGEIVPSFVKDVEEKTGHKIRKTEILFTGVCKTCLNK